MTQKNFYLFNTWPPVLPVSINSFKKYTNPPLLWPPMPQYLPGGDAGRPVVTFVTLSEWLGARGHPSLLSGRTSPDEPVYRSSIVLQLHTCVPFHLPTPLFPLLRLRLPVVYSGINRRHVYTRVNGQYIHKQITRENLSSVFVFILLSYREIFVLIS